MGLEADFVHPIPTKHTGWHTTSPACVRLAPPGALSMQLGCCYPCSHIGIWFHREKEFGCEQRAHWSTQERWEVIEVRSNRTVEDKEERRHGSLKDSHWGRVRGRGYKILDAISVWRLWRAGISLNMRERGTVISARNQAICWPYISSLSLVKQIARGISKTARETRIFLLIMRELWWGIWVSE